MIEFRILGPLEVAGDDGLMRLGGPKQRATLAILLLNANRVVSVERLADELYAGAPPVTAVTQVQRQISELRKALGSELLIETRAPGYVILLAPDQLDVSRFERLTEEANRALARGDARHGAELFRDALAIWRGAPLADLAYESFAQTSIERLEEIRLAAVETRIDAELALARHAALVAELEELVSAQPLRERLWGQLMLALYRSGRQPDALDAYRRARETLVEQFGIEPARPLRELEQAILNQAPSLDVQPAAAVAVRAARQPDRAVLVISASDAGMEEVLSVAEPLARPPGRELILARLLDDEGDVPTAAAAVSARRASLGVPARTAAFTTSDTARDVVRLATTYDVDLVVVDAPPGVDGEDIPDELAGVFERSPADVAVVSGSRISGTGGIFVPFAGGGHDWAALELGAWLSLGTGAPLNLVGTKADPGRDRRDASRLLADAALAVQQLVAVDTQPVLAEASEDGLVRAVQEASVLVVGISERWRRDGIGDSRRALVRHRGAPTVIVHRGPRPGGLSPSGTRSRFTWTFEPPYPEAVSTA